MSIRTVTTQSEFDQAVKDSIDYIDIKSSDGVWIEVRACDSSTVRAYDSSTVRAYDSSTITAYGSSTVRAYDSSTVTAYDSSTVTAHGSSTVRAYVSSTVTACGSSTVRACDSSTVRACNSSTVRAKCRVAVHLHSGRAHVTGGVLIDHTQEPGDAEGWCRYHDVEVVDGVATVYKAVTNEWTTNRGTSYAPGSTPSAPDWGAEPECGHGLHFSPTPVEAMSYHPDATRFVAVGVRLDELVPILGGTAECKAPRVVVPCREVTIDMDEVER